MQYGLSIKATGESREFEGSKNKFSYFLKILLRCKRCKTLHEKFLFLAKKNAKKWRPYWIFGHRMAKKQNFQNRHIKFVECHTGKVHSKFQVPIMFSVQMNVPFVIFQNRDLKVLHVLYLQTNPDFQNIITQVRKNIFHAEFCIFNITTTSLKINKLVFGRAGPLTPTCGLNMKLKLGSRKIA